MVGTAPDPLNPNANVPGPTSPSPTAGTPPNLPNPGQEIDAPLFYTDINPGSPPDQKTLVYSPDVQILIARGNTQYDVSRDIVAVSVQRNENAVSTLVFKLSNKDKRYNQLFERMDRVVCRMKRVTWIQTFSGYLDRVPHIQLYPGVVTFRASCTLKRILHTWWDPGLPASGAIFDQAGLHSNEQANGEQSVDTGLGSLLRRFLVEVGGWDPKNVHVQRFPQSYYLFMQQQLKLSQKGIDQNVHDFKRMMLGDDITLGTWAAAGKQAGVSRGSYTIAPGGDRQLEVLRTVDDLGMGPDIAHINASQGMGDAASHSADNKDKPAWQEQQEVTRNWENYGKESDAAIHCFMCIQAESGFRMLANNSVPDSLNFPNEGVGSDGTSVGLYQQTEGNGWGTVAQRMNVRESTEMFLQRLNGLNWRNMSRATAVQTVQGSAFSDGSNYAVQEQAAIEAVRTLRQNQTPGSGASPTTDPTKVTLPGNEQAALPAVPGAPTNTNNLAAPRNADSPEAAAAAATHRPRFDTQGAINYARAQIGKPYVWGAAGPDSFDCSGLTMMAYKSIEIEIPHNTHAQLAVLQQVTMAQAKPGDLIYPNGVEHVVMLSDTPGMVIEAQQSGVPVHEVPFAAAGVDPSSNPIGHVAGTEWGGPGAATFNAFPTSPGHPPSTVQDGVNGTTMETEAKEPIARNLFTYMFVAPPGDKMSMMLGAEPGTEEKAFMNDQSMMPTVISMATAGLRKFQSLPNGDFAAYYPDYFGLDGKRAVLKLQDVEMKNVQLDLNDDALCTHAYVAGSQSIQADAVGFLGWVNSRGFATVENEFLFRWMTRAAPSVKGERLTSGKDIMRRFGVRPLIQSMPMIQSGAMEFLCAVALFMEKWAEQYATTVELTFMPELYPGQRVELVGHNLQVYVSQVTHNCDFENGFTTTATIMAPSNTNVGQILSATWDTAKSIADTLNMDLDAVIAHASEWLP